MRYLIKTADQVRNTTLSGTHVLAPVKDPRLPEKWMYDPQVTEHNSHGLFNYTDKDVASFMQAIENRTCVAWDILEIGRHETFYGVESPMPKSLEELENRRRDQEHIGRITLQSIDWINRSAELAIVIGEVEKHKKGVATAAVAKVLVHAKDKLGLHRVWTGTSYTNHGMQRVCEKNGFKLEGTFKEAMLLNGIFFDILAYGKIL